MAANAHVRKVTLFTGGLTGFRTSEPHFILPHFVSGLAAGSTRPNIGNVSKNKH